MKSFLPICSLIWLVCVDVGLSLPNLNATDSSPIDHQVSEDERTNQLEIADAKQKTTSPETRLDMEGLQFNYRPRKDTVLDEEWATRGIFSGRRHRHGMSPRSLFSGRRFGYFGRHPSRFRRYAPYGPYDDYASYPQTYGGGPMYNQAAYAQTLPIGQQTDFSTQPQSPYASTQLYPPAQSYYRDPYTMSPQQPQQFAAPSPYSSNSRVNAQPQYYTNRPGQQWANQQQPMGPTQPAGSPMMPDTRFQQTGSFDQFGAPMQPSGEPGSTRSRTSRGQRNRVPVMESELQRTGFSTQLTDERDGARSRNRDPLVGPELQRTAGSLDQFRTDGSGSPGPQENRRNSDQPAESERQLIGSNDQSRTSSPVAAGQRDGVQTPAETESAPGGNGPVSSLFSFLRSPSATTTANSSNPESRSIADPDPEPKQAREQPAVAQEATVAA